MYQNNPEDASLKTVKCRVIHTHKLVLKHVIKKSCPVLQLLVLIVKNKIWNNTFMLTPSSLFVIEVAFSAMRVGAAACTSNEIMPAENLALFH